MKCVRPLAKEDLSEVAELHRRVFGVNDAPVKGPASPAELQEYIDYFKQAFLENPWYDETMPPLVAEGNNGNIIGFLGVMPRRMSHRGRTIRVAVSSQFIIDPAARTTGASLALIKRFFSGPQDLSMTDEANDASRRLWEGFGAVAAPLYSLHWTRPLRPARHAVAMAGAMLGTQSPWAALLTSATHPFCNLADMVAARKLPHRYANPSPEVEVEELIPRQLLATYEEFGDARALIPQYDQLSLTWVIDTIRKNRLAGDLHARAIRNEKGLLLGWYVYLLKPGGRSTLLQIHARKSAIGDVISHLFHDAWRHGSLSVTGRMEPAFIHIFEEKRCSFTCGYPWMLLKSKDAGLLESIHHGDALLSKLEGEWCLHFR